MSETNIPRFFLGANTPRGFVSFFDELEPSAEPWHTFLIKGGPGTGKSSLLKRIAGAFAPSSTQMELDPCSSDPDSLDAVILPERGISLMDATPPHAREPKIPAVRQTIVSLGDYLDGVELQKNREEIEALYAALPRCSSLATDYLSAAHTFLANSRRITRGAVDLKKIEGYAYRFAEKNLRKKGLPEKGSEKHRFLTTIHSGGIYALEETPSLLCRRLYRIEDEIGIVAPVLLAAIRTYALELGHDVITCMCPMDPDTKIDHLLIPSAGIGFLTSNRYHPMEHAGAQRSIHAKRFMDESILETRKRRLSFDRKAARELLKQAILLLRESRSIHDDLERIYSDAMDFDALERRYPLLMGQILDYSTPKSN